MAEHSGTVTWEVTFSFGPGEAACLDVCETVIGENYLLTLGTRDNEAVTVTATGSINILVDPDAGTHGSYRVDWGE